MNAYTQQYQQNQILSASPEQILVMLYDGAIRFTRQAMIGIEGGRPSMKVEGISRAMAIITEFANTLDHEIGGEIAANLDGLYSFMIRELTQATLNDDMEKLKVVEGLLVDLRQTWIEAIEVARNEKSGEQPESKPMIPSDYKPLSAAG
ncbi:MAG: flagellar export chaperone FliS [Deltaproteobacteria bacterium]|nr:flagellar export chaperone FliS [Deltaproteobacteria bacterium]